MASMQARLHELSVKCDKFQAKYANRDLCEPDTVEAIHVILRQAVHMLVICTAHLCSFDNVSLDACRSPVICHAQQMASDSLVTCSCTHSEGVCSACPSANCTSCEAALPAISSWQLTTHLQDASCLAACCSESVREPPLEPTAAQALQPCSICSQCSTDRPSMSQQKAGKCHQHSTTGCVQSARLSACPAKQVSLIVYYVTSCGAVSGCSSILQKILY